jgi:hypothetical protein
MIDDWIAMVSYNSYINDYNRIKCIVRCLTKPVADGSVVPPDGLRMTLKFILLNLAPSGWSVLEWAGDSRLRPDGLCKVSDSTLFSSDGP